MTLIVIILFAFLMGLLLQLPAWLIRFEPFLILAAILGAFLLVARSNRKRKEAKEKLHPKTIQPTSNNRKVYTYDHPVDQMTKAEKLEAYIDWTEQDKFFRPHYPDWAFHKFNGPDPSGDPKVPQATLLGWKRYKEQTQNKLRSD